MRNPFARLLRRTFPLLLLALLGLAGMARGQGYTFTRILDSAQGFDASELGRPAINDSGVVAIRAQRTNGVTGIYRGTGGALTTLTENARDGYGFISRHPSIDNLGRVAFAARIGSAEAIAGANGAVVRNAVRTDQSEFNFFGFDVSLGDGSRVAFKAELDDFDEGLFVISPAGTQTIYLASASEFTGTDSGPSINNAGQVAFEEFTDAGVRGLFLWDGVVFVTIADDTGPEDSFGNPSLNSQGAVAFHAFLDNGTNGIFVGVGGQVTTIADSTGGAASFGDPSLNDNGDVAFTATLDGGRQGLFVASGGSGRRVILTGNALDGSTVTNLILGREGLNNAGQLAFRAQLADGRSVVFRATPSMAH